VGGTRPASGTFNLLVHSTDPRKKQMRYRLDATDANGKPITMTGFKTIQNDEGPDAWPDTTILYVKIYEGHVTEADEAAATVRGAGVIQIEPFDFLQQMTTFRVEGPSLAARIDGLNRFNALFLGKLWEVYGQPLAKTMPS
jgi:cholesterol oxidase